MSRLIEETGVTNSNDCKSEIESKNEHIKSLRPMFVPEKSDEESLEEPTNCCMSGCANCVWIQYAEKLSETFDGSTPDIQKQILEKVTDPNMRAFLSMELRIRNIK